MLSPKALHKLCPATETHRAFVQQARNAAISILRQDDPRLLAVVGPCSIHHTEEALDYARLLKGLALQAEKAYFFIMRVFVEKPRTITGWKGLVYDPRLDGSHDIEMGLIATRKLLLRLAELGIPCAAEFLDPLFVPYYEDLISWGFIGARTSASQPHRQIVSSLSFPVGFKNSVLGEWDPAIHGILSARKGHAYAGIDVEGRIALHRSQGNPHTHLVLRGSYSTPNCDAASVAAACSDLKRCGLEERLLIDCSHDNSRKIPRNQKTVFRSVLTQIEQGERRIAGVMLESYLRPGKQPHAENPASLLYGVSITDACLGWEETEELFLGLNKSLC